MDVKLPKLGEGAESGTVVSVMVKEGDTITEGQTILELENEKAVAPIPSPVSGKVTSVRAKEGDKLSVGQVILSVGEGNEPAPATASPKTETPSRAPAAKASSPRPSQPPEAPAPASPAPEAEAAEEPKPLEGGLAPAASPSIRKMARELGIDLSKIRGSERGGRIVLADVRAYIQRLQRLATQPQTAPTPKQPTQPTAERIDFSKWGPISRKPLSALRKIIGQRMKESWTTVPHVTQFDGADITALNELRKKHAAAYEKNGARLTLTSFVLKAVADTLKKHPMFNASLDGAAEEIVFKDYYHIGLAVDTDQGLLVPVLRNVDKKGMLELSKEIGDLAEKARTRKISLEEMKGGTFTISNQGGIGGGHFTPIINQPEVAILGLGRGALKAMVREKKLEPRLSLPLALSYDHRVIDGANAARFMVDLVGALENFPEAEVTAGQGTAGKGGSKKAI